MTQIKEVLLTLILFKFDYNRSSGWRDIVINDFECAAVFGQRPNRQKYKSEK